MTMKMRDHNSVNVHEEVLEKDGHILVTVDVEEKEDTNIPEEKDAEYSSYLVDESDYRNPLS